MAVEASTDDESERWRARLLQALSVAVPQPAPVERHRQTAGSAADTADTAASGADAPAERRAGVLIAVVDAPEPFIYFTQRSDALTHHPGQISFPGGRVEAWDASVEAAALRESHEEIGLASEAVTILGELSCYRTVTGFAISPFVGWVEANARVEPDGHEVERIFTVPLAFAMDIDSYRRHAVSRDGQEYEIYSINWLGNHIWGATAAMLYTLARQLADAEGRQPDPPSWAGSGLRAASGVVAGPS